MDLDGSNRRPVADPARGPVLSGLLAGHDEDPVLDHQRAVAGGRNIQVMDVATGVVKTLFDYSEASYDSGPAWSPDGSKIAFESNLDGDMELFVMNADGSGVQQLTHNTIDDEGAAWSPDGKRFAFTSGADDLHGDIWTMNADGTDQHQLTTYPGRDESPDWGGEPHPRRSAARSLRSCARRSARAPSFGTSCPASRATTTPRPPRPSRARQATRRCASATRARVPGQLLNGTFALPQPLLVARQRRGVRAAAGHAAQLRRAR